MDREEIALAALKERQAFTSRRSLSTGLAQAHFWVAVVGAILLVVGRVGAVMPNATLEKVVIPGSVLTLLAMVIFLVMVARHQSS